MPLILLFLYPCKGEALDCNPKGYHGFPKGNNQGLRPCMEKKSHLSGDLDQGLRSCMLTDAPANKSYVLRLLE